MVKVFSLDTANIKFVDNATLLVFSTMNNGREVNDKKTSTIY